MQVEQAAVVMDRLGVWQFIETMLGAKARLSEQERDMLTRLVRQKFIEMTPVDVLQGFRMFIDSELPGLDSKYQVDKISYKLVSNVLVAYREEVGVYIKEFNVALPAAPDKRVSLLEQGLARAEYSMKVAEAYSFFYHAKTVGAFVAEFRYLLNDMYYTIKQVSGFELPAARQQEIINIVDGKVETDENLDPEIGDLVGVAVASRTSDQGQPKRLSNTVRNRNCIRLACIDALLYLKNSLRYTPEQFAAMLDVDLTWTGLQEIRNLELIVASLKAEPYDDQVNYEAKAVEVCQHLAEDLAHINRAVLAYHSNEYKRKKAKREQQTQAA